MKMGRFVVDGHIHPGKKDHPDANSKIKGVNTMVEEADNSDLILLDMDAYGVDMGIILCQNILQHLAEAPPGANKLETIYRASSEVGSAVLTAISTTVIGFLPVFAMTGPEGKLFKPLAFTKTFCLIGSVVVALTVIRKVMTAICEKLERLVSPE